VNAILIQSGMPSPAPRVFGTVASPRYLTTRLGKQLPDKFQRTIAPWRVNSAGFKTTVFPVASAGAIFQASI